MSHRCARCGRKALILDLQQNVIVCVDCFRSRSAWVVSEADALPRISEPTRRLWKHPHDPSLPVAPSHWWSGRLRMSLARGLRQNRRRGLGA